MASNNQTSQLLDTDGQLRPSVLTAPFRKIALALSGGGFRAAAYSLGTMSYLNQVPYEKDKTTSLLDNVEFISSASGGTFAAILYSMHVKQQKGFHETYKALSLFMNGEVLLENVLEQANAGQWEADKSHNLINAFAYMYDKKLFGGETFGIYFPDKSGKPPTRLLEVCFNTTEFYRGISFRFQASNDSSNQGFTGNQYVRFDKTKEDHLQTLGKIRLGDIMAASSCFPAGFEPILFPKDFTYNGLDKASLKQALLVKGFDNELIDLADDIGFMDGGVDDNQGVYSLMTADLRRRRADPSNGFGLVIVTDVASYFMDPYSAPSVEPLTGWRAGSIGKLATSAGKIMDRISGAQKWTTFLSAMLFAVTASGLFFVGPGLFHDVLISLGTTGFWVLAASFIAKQILKKPLVKAIFSTLHLSRGQMAAFLQNQVKGTENFSAKTVESLLQFVENTPLGKLEQMLKARLNSTLAMVLDVNLKQTRRLIFDIFYGNFYGKDIWGNRRAFNVIYELSTFNIKSRQDTLHRKFFGPDFQLPGITDTWPEDCIHILTYDCGRLNLVAETARTMGTTLWFDTSDSKTQRARDVIACGQFTACAKLVEYILTTEQLSFTNEYVQLDTAQLAILAGIKNKLLADWERFKKEPYWLVEEYEKANGIYLQSISIS